MENNMKAMREALETMVNCIDWLCEGDITGRISKQFTPLLSQARDALSSPRLNCEVGTAEEQFSRHCAWCRKHGIDGDNKVNCVHQDMSCGLCTLRWSQMPYEESEATDGGK